MKIRTLLSASVLTGVAALAIPVASETPNPRIYYGREVAITGFSRQVAMVTPNAQSEDDLLCGGDLITPRYVLKAAHCVDSIQDRRVAGQAIPARGIVLPSAVRIRAGSSKYAKGGSLHAVAEIIVHPQWKATGYPMDYDAAILRLSDPVTAGKAVRLFRQDVDESFGKAWVSGWGKTDLVAELAKYSGRIPSASVPKMPGIFYRPAVDVAVRVSYCGTAVCLRDSASWFLKDTLDVPLPQFGAISPVPQRAEFMTRTVYKNAFKDGILVNYDGDRPSELLELARAPVRLVEGLFDGISKVISLRTGTNADRVSLSASELATFQSLGSDAEKMRLYQNCAAEKRDADAPLTPCLDLLV